MDNEKKHLLGFGYGLALLIPFLVWVHAIKIEGGGISKTVFVASLIVIFIVIHKIESNKLYYFGILAAVVCLLIKHALTHGFGLISLILLILALGALFVVTANAELLKPVYKTVMKIVHPIGVMVTGGILSIVFYLMFGVAGIILRILRKDLLDRKIDRTRDSYWIKREEVVFDKKHYQRQF